MTRQQIIPVFMAAFTAMAAVWFVAFRHNRGEVVDLPDQTAPVTSHAVSKTSTTSTSEALAKAAETKRAHEELERHMRETKELGASIARQTTPEIQKTVVDSMMRRREPGLREAMRSWGVDASTMDQVVNTIRERELNLAALRNKFLEKGSSYARDFAKEEAAQRIITEAQLAALLGQKNAQALIQIDGRSRIR